MAELGPIERRQKFEALRNQTRTPKTRSDSGGDTTPKDWTSLGSGSGAVADKKDWTQLDSEGPFPARSPGDWTQVGPENGQATAFQADKDGWTRQQTPPKEPGSEAGWLGRALQTASSLIMGPSAGDWNLADRRPPVVMGLTGQDWGRRAPHPSPMRGGGPINLRETWDGDWSAAMSAYKHLSPRQSGADLIEDYTMEEPDSLHELNRRIVFLEKRIGQLNQHRNEDTFGQLESSVNELHSVQGQLHQKRAEKAAKQRQHSKSQEQHRLVSDELTSRESKPGETEDCADGFLYSPGLGGYGSKKQTKLDLEWQKQQLQTEVSQLSCEIGRLDSDIPSLEARQAQLFNQLETLQGRLSAEPAKNRQQINDFLVYYENQLAHLQHCLSRVNGGFDGYFK